MHLRTAAVQTLRDNALGAVVPPVHLASTFELDPATEEAPFAYQRGDNPTRAQLEAVLAALDGAEHAFAFASGMAANAAVFSTLEVGDEVILPATVYGGTFRFVARLFPRAASPRATSPISARSRTPTSASARGWCSWRPLPTPPCASPTCGASWSSPTATAPSSPWTTPS